MQKTPSIFLGIMACFIITLSFTACKKDSKPSTDSDTTAAQDNAMAESAYTDANTMVDASVTYGANFSFRVATNEPAARIEEVLGNCVTVTIDTVNATRSVVINFGTTNCLCVDGRKRRGRILANWTGRYREAGTVVNITYDNYFVNDNQIKGTHKTTNMGANNAGNLVYKIEVNGTIVKANNGGEITWESTRQREWVAGINTPLNILDDIYSITGSATGTVASGHAYTINITQALVRKMTCNWFESGKIELTPEGLATRTLDYGSSGCDANATVTIGGATFNVVLP
ncbi:hypothetical protein [Longitalea luteola]|uniref:hypothetical protein n=1 Tax=Longitalea luteola TaxID=2812563 RepID=UPI001A9672DC|nr:hypothetical protein [Longitalea luteola]